MIADLADTGVTKVRMFRPHRQDAGLLFGIRQEWASFDDAVPTLIDFFLLLHSIQAINSAPAAITTKPLIAGGLLLREEDSLANGGLHRIFGIRQPRVLSENWEPHFPGDTEWQGHPIFLTAPLGPAAASYELDPIQGAQELDVLEDIDVLIPPKASKTIIAKMGERRKATFQTAFADDLKLS